MAGTVYRLVDRAPARAAAGGDDAALARLLARLHRLPSFARDHTFHAGEPRLAHALRRLQGKFSVVNPVVQAALPPLVRERLPALLRAAAAAAPGTSAAPAAPAAPVDVALHEPLHPEVRHEVRAPTPSTMPGRDILFWAELRHRLVVGPAEAVGDPRAAAAARPAGPPLPWAHAAALMPDADALRQMVPTTAHFYRHVTGRLGRGSQDCYWYLDAWERFHEAGRVIGCISPTFVEHGHVGGAGSAGAAPSPPAAPTLEDVLFGDLDAVAPRPFPRYTPRFDRRGFVPPGYCLIHYFATVELAVVAPGRWEEAAA